MPFIPGLVSACETFYCRVMLSRSGLERVGAAVLAAAAATAAVLLFGSGGGDDSHITWWVVDALVRVGQIININGVRLEQSSSLALVIVVAALKCVTPLSTPALGVLFSLTALIATAWMTGHVASRIDPRFRLVATILVATSAPLTYWATSGMETALSAFSAVWLIEAVLSGLDISQLNGRRRLAVQLQLFVAVFLYATVRPENPLLLFLFVIIAFMLQALKWSGALTAFTELRPLIVMALLVVLPLFAYRRLTFGEWFPHPVAAKTGGAAHWIQGAHYLVQQSTTWAPLLCFLVPLSFVIVVRTCVRSKAELLAVLIAAQSFVVLFFIISSGGDWMAAGRFLAVGFPAWWLLVLAAGRSLSTPRWRSILLVSACALVVNVATMVKLALGKEANGYPLVAALRVVPAARQAYALGGYSFLELANKSHLRDAVASEELKIIVAKALKRRTTLWLASGQAGAIPYDVFSTFPNKLHFIDFWGLTTAELLPCVKDKVHSSRLGLTLSMATLFSDAARIEEKCGVPTPDIIFNTSLRVGTRRQLEGFGYRVVYFQGGAMPSFRDPHSGFEGGTRMDTYIAVRQSLADDLDLRYHELRWDFGG